MIRIRILIFTRTDLDPTIVLRVHSFYMKLCLASLFFLLIRNRRIVKNHTVLVITVSFYNSVLSVFCLYMPVNKVRQKSFSA